MAMAPFSFQNYNPFLLESSSRLFPNTITNDINNSNNNNNNNKMCSSILEEPNSFTPWFPHQFYRPETPLQELSSVNFSSSTKVSLTSSNNSSSLLPGDQLTQKITPMSHKKRKQIINSAQYKDTREAVLEGKKKRKSYNNEKKKSGGSNNNKKKRKAQSEEEAPTGYIHVRARRGQATDSHSLAERARRQKISEKMKMLQALVPGCDNVTGKALLLDEIINYVQSLQNQVEFLSMELASVNSFFYDFGVDMEAFMVKPERVSTSEAPQQPDAQHCSPNQSATNTFTTANNYSLMDPANLLLLQQGQMPTILSQDNEQLLWDAYHEQRQQNISQPGFSDNSCSFL